MTQPAEKPTVEIEKPPTWAIAMRDQMVQGFLSVRADVALVADDVKLTKERITVVEGRVSSLEEARQRNSERAKGQSEIDAAQAAQLVQERDAREALATKVDALTTINQQQLAVMTALADGAKKLSEHPLVKLLVIVATIIATAWLSRHGIEVTK